MSKSRKSFKEKDILEIEWEDSVSSNRWETKNAYLDDPNDRYLNHKSVGYLLHETNTGITIMQSYCSQPYQNENYQTAERQMIPKKSITKIRKL